MPLLAAEGGITTMSMEERQHDNEWPSLTATTTATTAATNSSCISEATAVVIDNKDKDDDDWELLNKKEIKKPVLIRKSSSSPDFHRCLSLQAVDEEEEGEGEEKNIDEDDFSLISGPASVVSLLTTATSATATTTSAWGKGGLSFKDAILSSSGEGTEESKTSSSQRPRAYAPSPRRTTTSRAAVAYRPRFVVTPIRRCAKSTGDLRSLARCQTTTTTPSGAAERVDDDDEEEEILGATDAAEFYHRKAAGAVGRVNGKKQRPDEAKRKQISMYKKQQQRQRGQQGRGH